MSRTGSVWLTTPEAETSPVIKEKLLAATSRGTIRSKSRTGKYCRQLRSAWTDAWEEEGAPKPLPMPLQSIISDTSMSKVLKLANGGHSGARELASFSPDELGMDHSDYMRAMLSVQVSLSEVTVELQSTAQIANSVKDSFNGLYRMQG